MPHGNGVAETLLAASRSWPFATRLQDVPLGVTKGDAYFLDANSVDITTFLVFVT
jgi:hypothetical protein